MAGHKKFYVGKFWLLVITAGAFSSSRCGYVGQVLGLYEKCIPDKKQLLG